MNINIFDFYGRNAWEDVPEGGVIPGTDRAKYVKDSSTGRIYLNKSDEALKAEMVASGALAFCVAPTLLTLNSWRMTVEVVHDIYILARRSDHSEPMMDRVERIVKNSIRISLTPAVSIGLRAVALYGFYDPRSGRKLFATAERVMFDKPFLMPSLQPVTLPRAAQAQQEAPAG